MSDQHLSHLFAERIIKSQRVIENGETPFILHLGKQVKPETPEEKAERMRRLREADTQANALIRRAQAERDTVLSNGKNEAQVIIETARKEAARMIGEAETARDGITAAARAEGYEAGHRDGYQEGLGEGKMLFEKMNTIFHEAVKERSHILDEARMGLVDVVMSVAARVIKREVREDRAIVIGNLREALQRIRGKEEVTVRVNPSDVEVLEEHREEFGRWVRGLSSVEIKSDSAIEPGGCLVETNFGKVDARVDSQLEEIEKTLRSAAHQESAETLAQEAEEVEKRDISETADSENTSNLESEDKGAGEAE